MVFSIYFYSRFQESGDDEETLTVSYMCDIAARCVYAIMRVRSPLGYGRRRGGRDRVRPRRASRVSLLQKAYRQEGHDLSALRQEGGSPRTEGTGQKIDPSRFLRFFSLARLVSFVMITDNAFVIALVFHGKRDLGWRTSLEGRS